MIHNFSFPSVYFYHPYRFWVKFKKYLLFVIFQTVVEIYKYEIVETDALYLQGYMLECGLQETAWVLVPLISRQYVISLFPNLKHCYCLTPGSGRFFPFFFFYKKQNEASSDGTSPPHL